jgi:TPR repeat protein
LLDQIVKTTVEIYYPSRTDVRQDQCRSLWRSSFFRRLFIAAGIVTANCTAAGAAGPVEDAAGQGNTQAQYNLGSARAKGEGVPQDYTEAAKWYRLAADQGYAPAQTSLGLAYETGRGVPQDYVEAMKWYRLAADKGDALGQFKLGSMYHSGRGTAQNYVEAVKWYRLAADQGSAEAQYELGTMYYGGWGVPKNHAEALKLFEQAAKQNHAGAQSNLAAMSANGQLDTGGQNMPVVKLADKGIRKDPRFLRDQYEYSRAAALAALQHNDLAQAIELSNKGFNSLPDNHHVNFVADHGGVTATVTNSGQQPFSVHMSVGQFQGVLTSQDHQYDRVLQRGFSGLLATAQTEVMQQHVGGGVATSTPWGLPRGYLGPAVRDPGSPTDARTYAPQNAGPVGGSTVPTAQRQLRPGCKYRLDGKVWCYSPSASDLRREYLRAH